MTKFKKVIAMALALLMIFGCVSVMASAWDAAVDGGTAVTVKTSFYRNTGTTEEPVWTATDKAIPGEAVKARVWLTTDYYSNDATLLFFYDKDFFSTSLGTTGDLSMNADSEFVDDNGLDGWYVTDSSVVEDDLVEYTDVTAEYIEDNGYILVSLDMANPTNVIYNSEDWLFEFDMTVDSDATGSADLAVLPGTFKNATDRQCAFIDIPKGEENGSDLDVWSMELWYEATPTIVNDEITTDSSVIFDANGGLIDEDASVTLTGTIGTDYTVPSDPTREGYTFDYWYLEGDEDMTEVDFTTHAYALDEVTYVAKWIQNVNIYFETGDGSAIEPILDVTPGTAFADVNAPTPANGYHFKGWDSVGGTLPSVYPDEDTTYTAVYAKIVTIGFDTDGDGNVNVTKTGDAGDAFTETVNRATKTGYTFAGWTPAFPTVFPADDTTYYAAFEAKTAKVYYYVKDAANGATTFSIVSAPDVPYGAEISDTAPGYTAPKGAVLGDWYSDQALQNAYDFTDATMGTSAIRLYAVTSVGEYDATFYVDGVLVSDWTDEDVAFDSAITAPSDTTVATYVAANKAGYVFAGWNPLVGLMSEEGMRFDAILVPNGSLTATFDPDNGDQSEVFTLAYGDDLEVPVDPVKEGYEFQGWSTDGETVIELPETMPNANVSYIAVYEAIELNITYTYTGTVPDGAADLPEDATSTDGSPVTLAAEPTLTGYTFSGWIVKDAHDVTVTVTDGAFTMPSSDVTISGSWTAIDYTVTFSYEGTTPTGATPASSFDMTGKHIGDTITLTAPQDTAAYHFEGWTAYNGEDEIQLDGSSFEMPAANVTVVGSWSQKSCKVYLISTETSWSDEYDVNVGDMASLPEGFEEPTRTGYELVGWSTDGTADGIVDLDEYEITSTSGATFYAVWEQSVATVTYYVDSELYDVDGNPFTENIGGTVTLLAEPEKTDDLLGKEFSGWTVTQGTTPVTVTDGTFVMPAGNVTVSGEWTVVTDYTVTFMKYDGSTGHGPAGGDQLEEDAAAKNTGLKVGDSITFPAEPSIPNYGFIGWYDSSVADANGAPTGNLYASGDTLTTEGLTLYPFYTRNVVKLIPAVGSSYVVERYTKVGTRSTAVKEQWTDDSVTDDAVAPATAGDFSQYFVYGISHSRLRYSNVQAMVAVYGDGRLVWDTNNTGGGTGTIVKVYDNITDELVEQFYIVIFGDLNGDLKVNDADYGLLSRELGSLSWSARATKVPYMVKAADLNTDTRINDADRTKFKVLQKDATAIDLTTGKVS